MAVDTLKDFGIQWALFALLFFCMLSFALYFSYHNNPNALGDSGDFYETSRSSLQTQLISTEDSSNALMNITAETNPEVSDLGSRDSVATSYGNVNKPKGFFESTKIFIAWIFTGATGQMLVTVFSGMFLVVSLYLIIKAIRNGL